MSQAAEQERTKKLIVYSIFGLVLVVFVIYAYESFFAGSGGAPPVVPPVAVSKPGPAPRSSGAGGTQSGGQSGAQGLGAAAGVAAIKLASTSSSLDPTLDEGAMLRTESLVYSGTGRNIFSMTAAAPVAIPDHVPPPRPVAAAPVGPVVPQGPPPPPPINIKYFGTETRADGRRQAFLLEGEDVYLASEGDIVARKYKILSIATSGIKVEDLTNHNTQTLPAQGN